MNLCKDCKHFPRYGSMIDIWGRRAGVILCARTYQLVSTGSLPDLVMGETGTISLKTCKGCRSEGGDCGPQGKFFERLQIPEESEYYFYI